METICFQSNWPVVDLFLGKTTGLLALIDEESRFPRATNRTLAAKMHKAHHRGQEAGSEVGQVYRAPPDKGAKFGVNHYAGYVSDCYKHLIPRPHPSVRERVSTQLHNIQCPHVV